MATAARAELEQGVDPERGATLLVKRTVLRAADADAFTPLVEAQVHKALDLVRAFGGGTERLRRLEEMSCALVRLQHARRHGLVNAYASSRLRLLKAAQAL